LNFFDVSDKFHVSIQVVYPVKHVPISMSTEKCI